ncbi:CBS domain-containing protein [Lichenicoccus sp.]|uniref:CBS domain-containing protein n=1 Tax=Lichenicoccus sp. TaxID=2781899 RepID=UPI003D0ADDDB
MTVASILASKPRTLVSVTPETTVGEVARLLHERQIGAALVMQGDTLLGILSERGIVRALALHPSGVRGMRADSVMKPRQVETHLSATLEEAMRIMTDNRVRYLPVFEDGHLAGLISIGDVVKAELGRHAHEVTNLTAYISGAH